jgi:hypothetical protein
MGKPVPMKLKTDVGDGNEGSAYRCGEPSLATKVALKLLPSARAKTQRYSPGFHWPPGGFNVWVSDPLASVSLKLAV